jgi:uncharacterized membrane protein (GlpM family)
MHDAVILLSKGLAGGALVVAFALLSQGLAPKRFAGLFSAAPAVALAGLTITLLDTGARDARQSTIAMLAGGAGMIAYAAVSAPLLRRLTASRAAAAAMPVWLLVTAVVEVPILLR